MHGGGGGGGGGGGAGWLQASETFSYSMSLNVTKLIQKCNGTLLNFCYSAKCLR
jgi:hypothetical protein